MFYKERRPQSVAGFETGEQKKILRRKKKGNSSYLGNSREVMKFSRGWGEVWRAIRESQVHAHSRGTLYLPEMGLPMCNPATLHGQQRAATGHSLEETQRRFGAQWMCPHISRVPHSRWSERRVHCCHCGFHELTHILTLQIVNHVFITQRTSYFGLCFSSLDTDSSAWVKCFCVRGRGLPRWTSLCPQKAEGMATSSCV